MSFDRNHPNRRGTHLREMGQDGAIYARPRRYRNPAMGLPNMDFAAAGVQSSAKICVILRLWLLRATTANIWALNPGGWRTAMAGKRNRVDLHHPRIGNGTAQCALSLSPNHGDGVAGSFHAAHLPCICGG